jgi:UDP-3-O-[3-hydroxymyristoyl] glucosamine N-acyltransferase
MRLTLGEIANIVKGEAVGGSPEESARTFSGVAGLEDAGPEDISFLLKPSFLEKVARSGAGAVLVKERQPGLEKPQVIVPDPQLAFVRLLEHFYGGEQKKDSGKGVSPLAHISPDAGIAPDVSVFPFAYIAEGAKVARGSIIYSGVFIGRDSEIGEDCILYPNVTIRRKVKIGNKVIIHSGAVVGSDGFGYIFREGKHVKIPQVGGVIVEDDVEIGACTTIDRATTGNTVIGKGTKIDNLVQIAHNVKIGQGSIIVSQTGIAGSTRVGDFVIIGGQAGIADHATIEDGSVLGAGSGVLPNDTIKKGAYAGSPVVPHRQWLKMMAVLQKMPELQKEIGLLKTRLGELERRLADDRD